MVFQGSHRFRAGNETRRSDKARKSFPPRSVFGAGQQDFLPRAFEQQLGGGQPTAFVGKVDIQHNHDGLNDARQAPRFPAASRLMNFPALSAALPGTPGGLR
jgi:hypothetical protein